MAERDLHKKSNTKPKKSKNMPINIGIVVFVAIFLYMLVYVATYLNHKTIAPYVVQEGFLSTNQIYTGIAIRDEVVINSKDAGYINYYVREDERVAVDALVYTLDGTGRLADLLDGNELGDNSLSDKELSKLRDEIIDYKYSFDPSNFSSIYDFKFSVKGTVMKLANHALMDELNEIKNDSDVRDFVTFCYSEYTGIVQYWLDGFEGYTSEMLSAEHFKKDNYKKEQLLNSELVEQGEHIYKVCTNEEWSVVLPIEEAKGQELLNEEYIKVRFVKNQEEAWGRVDLLHNADGTYLELNFTNSMITFAGDRFLEVELILNEDIGLKIPNTSIIQKEFFLIPKEYVTQSGTTGTYGVLRERAMEDGTITTEYTNISIYSLIDNEYYVDNTVLRSGDQLVMPQSTNASLGDTNTTTELPKTHTVSKIATLTGVYNMNKGYADFRQIEILYQNEEYSIVKSNTKYGLNVYDLIVLEADAVSDDEFIYE
ncbi:MAG: hypothetical protein IJW63_01245 [Lachnospiraceae bacterium]|nr:hypothetical protein [Lachnospiraceae bacterium]